MGRNRRRDEEYDDDSDEWEYESPRERSTRIKGGFGFGFLGSIGCVCGLVLLFCVLPIGFLATGGCVVKDAVEKVREQEQRAAQKGK